jgi:hypothetical protein
MWCEGMDLDVIFLLDPSVTAHVVVIAVPDLEQNCIDYTVTLEQNGDDS